MNLRHALGGNAVDVFVRIEVVILRADIDVVHVEQNAAVGALDHFVQKLPFGHLRVMKLGIAADILDRDGDFDEIAHLANFSAVASTASNV